MASPDGHKRGRPETSAAKPPVPPDCRARRRPSPTLAPVLAGLAALAMLSACGDEPEPELSVETQLEAAAGRELTPTEIARQIEIADTLCGMNDDVLAAIWDQLEDSQLAFQDFVFGSHCPDRSVTYGLATGRTLTPEARVAAAEQEDNEPTSSTIELPDPAAPPQSGAGETPVTSAGPSISIAGGDDG